jgi:hypothetical protein
VEIHPLPQQLTESWNGTSWTEVNDLNTARDNLAGAGTQYFCFSFWWKYFRWCFTAKQKNGMELVGQK